MAPVLIEPVNDYGSFAGSLAYYPRYEDLRGHDSWRPRVTVKRPSANIEGYLMNGNTVLDPGPGYLLEVRSLSYIRSFTSGRWFAKLINPPITAQFLKDINLLVQGGEVMGLIGSAGSGKTTLLNVVARRCQGTTGGTVLLNHRTLTERVFQNSCAYISSKQPLLPELTVTETLHYQTALGLANSLSSSEKSERVTSLMVDFDLYDVHHRRVSRLPESLRRRLIVASQLIRDPLLILVDEPCRDLDPLSSYQLMSQLASYIKRNNRMAIVTMMIPRSDIYPLLDRTTILFFGEVMYSGYTKQMPQYFRHVGYSCPASENPAVYYMCLATVDRETSERYVETQEQAVKLIELFKTHGEPYARFFAPLPELYSANPFLSLCTLGRPSAASKFFTLLKRTIVIQWRSWHAVWRLLMLPLFGILLFLFCYRLEVRPTSPQTRFGLCWNCLVAASLIGAVLPSTYFATQRWKYYQDTWDHLYGGFLFISSHLLTPLPLDAIATFGFTAIVYWGCNIGDNGREYAMFGGLLYCVQQFAVVQTLCLLVVLKDGFGAAVTSLVLLTLQLISASGFTKSLRDYYSGSMNWLYYVTYASPYRPAAARLASLTSIRNISLCSPNQPSTDSICRWRTNNDYLNEVYMPYAFSHTTLNFWLPFAYLAAAVVIAILIYSCPTPHIVKKRFRYK